MQHYVEMTPEENMRHQIKRNHKLKQELTKEQEVLKQISKIAHEGGIIGLNQFDALMLIRRLTLPYWDKNDHTPINQKYNQKEPQDDQKHKPIDTKDDPAKTSIIIKNHWNNRELVIIEIGTETRTVFAEELRAAIDNATNLGRY